MASLDFILAIQPTYHTTYLIFESTLTEQKQSVWCGHNSVLSYSIPIKYQVELDTFWSFVEPRPLLVCLSIVLEHILYKSIGFPIYCISLIVYVTI